MTQCVTLSKEQNVSWATEARANIYSMTLSHCACKWLTKQRLVIFLFSFTSHSTNLTQDYCLACKNTHISRVILSCCLRHLKKRNLDLHPHATNSGHLNFCCIDFFYLFLYKNLVAFFDERANLSHYSSWFIKLNQPHLSLYCMV